MRARRQLIAGAAAAVLAAACGETTAPAGNPVTMGWLEWPSAVTATHPGTVRLLFTTNGCARLRIGFAVRHPQIVVQVEDLSDLACRAQESIRFVDTTVALPQLPGQSGPADYALVATVRDGWYDVGLRVVGYITAAATLDTTRRVAGEVRFTADSLGCAWLQPASSWEEAYVVINPPALGTGDYYGGTIAGRIEPMIPARCGQSRGIRLDLVRIDGQ